MYMKAQHCTFKICFWKIEKCISKRKNSDYKLYKFHTLKIYMIFKWIKVSVSFCKTVQNKFLPSVYVARPLMYEESKLRTVMLLTSRDLSVAHTIYNRNQAKPNWVVSLQRVKERVLSWHTAFHAKKKKKKAASRRIVNKAKSSYTEFSRSIPKEGYHIVVRGSIWLILSLGRAQVHEHTSMPVYQWAQASTRKPSLNITGARRRKSERDMGKDSRG